VLRSRTRKRQCCVPGSADKYGKALREMVHRYAAASLGILIVLMAALAWVRRGTDNLPQRLPWVLLATVLLQGALGMLTVTWLLKPLIVTLHLLGGLTTLALLWWLWLRPEKRELHASETALRRLAVAGIAVLALQIVLGGWTSSNYAAAACPDFPTCQGAWWPKCSSAMRSSYGAVSESITTAACSITRRASRCTSLTGWAQSSPQSAWRRLRCSQYGARAVGD
jgi:heme A synthase